MVLRQSLSLTTVGIAAGVVTAIMAVTLLQSMLFGLPPIDIPAFGASIGIILLATVVASAVPAHRATRVDPMVTLRSD